MNKHYLQSKIKSTGTAYLFWFFFGAHYAYLGKLGIQILYWITLGGLGIWALIDLFTMSGKVNNYNADIFQQIEAIEKKEKEESHERNLAMMAAASKRS
jgi:TM2 domain-containing membrane protein YozV